MAVIFVDPGSDATQDLSFWDAIQNTVASATDQVYTGKRSIKITTTNLDTTYARKANVLADAGRCLSFRYRFDALPGATSNVINTADTGAVNDIAVLQITTAGLLKLVPIGATTVDGTTALKINTWYRISISYTITNTTTFQFKVYINGVLEINATAGTMTTIGTNTVYLSADLNWGNGVHIWYDDIYIDDRSDKTDPGNISLVHKRPNANGTTNGFTTQIGSGGSSYGTGHAPQVNEQPLSITNGWSMVGAGSAVTEEYNVEDISTGDVNVSGDIILDIVGWLYTKALAAETGKIIVNGTSTNISITTTASIFQKGAGSGTYPAGTGTDIGITTSTDLTTVSLYECGIIIVRQEQMMGQAAM